MKLKKIRPFKNKILGGTKMSSIQKPIEELEKVGISLNKSGSAVLSCKEKFLESFLDENQLVIDKEDGKIYKFNGVYWTYLNERNFGVLLKEKLDSVQNYLWGHNFTKIFLEYAKVMVKPIERMNPHRHIISFKDFDFDFREGTITVGKDPEKYFTYAKNITLKELEQKTPVFDQLLLDITQGSEDFERYLLQMMGILLSGENRVNLAFILFGIGRNAKSLILKLVEHLIGKEFVASRRIESFNKQFGLDGLQNAKLVTCGEIDVTKPVNFEMVKSITGNDTVEIEGKGKAIISQKLFLNFIFSTNELFDIIGGFAIERRLHVIEFAYQVPDEKVDINLFDKLLKEEAGIINKIMESYTSMLKDDGSLNFKMSNEVREFSDKYFVKHLVSPRRNRSEEQNSCIRFIEEYFEKGTATDKISKSKVYNLYCSEIQEISEGLFWKNIKSTLDRMDVKIKKNIERFLEGIKIKEVYSHLIQSQPTLSSRKVISFPPQNLSIEEVI